MKWDNSAGILRFTAVVLLAVLLIPSGLCLGASDLLSQLSVVGGSHMEKAVLALARQSLMSSVRGTRPPDTDDVLSSLNLPEQTVQLLTRRSAGVFVTVVAKNKVRACVGSIWPNTGSIASEISHFGGLAAARDLRRPPIEPSELAGVDLAVSIVGRLERVQKGHVWDPARYGVFVRSGGRSGVILPGEALTHAKQVSWALAEAGISSSSGYETYRFQTVKLGASISVRH